MIFAQKHLIYQRQALKIIILVQQVEMLQFIFGMYKLQALLTWF